MKPWKSLRVQEPLTELRGMDPAFRVVGSCDPVNGSEVGGPWMSGGLTRSRGFGELHLGAASALLWFLCSRVDACPVCTLGLLLSGETEAGGTGSPTHVGCCVGALGTVWGPQPSSGLSLPCPDSTYGFQGVIVPPWGSVKYWVGGSVLSLASAQGHTWCRVGNV